MHFFGHRGNRYRRIVRQARHLQCASRLFGQSRLWRSGRRSGSTQIHLLCGQRRRLHTCRHHRSDIRDASGMAYRRKRALFAMPCGCDRRLQSATRRDLVIEACVRIISSCGDQSLGETPGPIPNPEAKAWHGDGTAPDRVWESSTPPHHTYRKPLGAHAPRGFPHIRNTHDPNPHTPTKTPGASRTHETHVRDHSRPAPPSGPKRDGAARSHFRRKSGKQHVRDRGIPTPGPPPPRSAVRTAPLRGARNWLGYGVALHWLLLCITSPLNVALRRIKSCITIRRRFSVPLIKA